MKILFVCLGNICRSPLAEGVFIHLASQAGRSEDFSVDSAGTAAYHQGSKPDPRSQTTALAHGFNLNHFGRQVTPEDFSNFDLILAMDQENLSSLKAMARNEGQMDKIRLFRDFDPHGGHKDVPDPYYGSHKDFEAVYDISFRVCSQLLSQF